MSEVPLYYPVDGSIGMFHGRVRCPAMAGLQIRAGAYEDNLIDCEQGS